MSTPLSRRQLLAAAVTGAAALTTVSRAQQQNWQSGSVRHLLPGISHNRLLLKASFVRAITAPPTLRAAARRATGVRLDTAGEFYSFDLTGLDPEQIYQLILEDAAGKPLCDPWPISTFPNPRARTEEVQAIRISHARAAIPPRVNPDTNRSVLGVHRKSAKDALDGAVV